MEVAKKSLLVGLVLISMSLTTIYADSTVSVTMNGEQMALEKAAVVESGRTFLPMRALFEAFGFSVTWNPTDQTIVAQRDTYQVNLKIGAPEARVNEASAFLDVPPQIIGGSTYVPLRFVAESLGAEVNWLSESRQVNIATTALDKPVQFSDSYLSGVFKTRLNKEVFTVRDFYYTTKLDLSSEGIYKIDGMEHFVNLIELDISKNNITFLDSLAPLKKLKALNVSNNQVKDLQPLKPLVNLETVDLSSNKITDYRALVDMKSVQNLKISNNSGTDYSPLYFTKERYSFLDISLKDIDMPKYDTEILRNDARYAMAVSATADWVPAIRISSMDFTNEAIRGLLITEPEGQRNGIRSLYDALRLLQLDREFQYKADFLEVKETDSGRVWKYATGGKDTLRANQGNQFALGQALGYLLNQDYQESGFLVVFKNDGTRLLLNYLRKDRIEKEKNSRDEDIYVTYPEYYVINYDAYRIGSSAPAAFETGNQFDFAKSWLTSNILMVKDLKDYGDFIGKGDSDIGTIIKIPYDPTKDMIIPIAEYSGASEATLKQIRILPKELKDSVTILFQSESNPVPIGYAERNLPSPDFSVIPSFDKRLYENE